MLVLVVVLVLHMLGFCAATKADFLAIILFAQIQLVARERYA